MRGSTQDLNEVWASAVDFKAIKLRLLAENLLTNRNMYLTNEAAFSLFWHYFILLESKTLIGEENKSELVVSLATSSVPSDIGSPRHPHAPKILRQGQCGGWFLFRILKADKGSVAAGFCLGY